MKRKGIGASILGVIFILITIAIVLSLVLLPRNVANIGDASQTIGVQLLDGLEGSITLSGQSPISVSTSGQNIIVGCASCSNGQASSIQENGCISSVITRVCSFSANPQTADLLLAEIMIHGQTTKPYPNTLTDNNGLTWIHLRDCGSSSNTNHLISVWYVIFTPAPTTETLTVTLNATSPAWDIKMYEIGAVNTAQINSFQSSCGTGTTTPLSVGSFTPNTNWFVLTDAIWMENGNTARTWTVDSPYLTFANNVTFSNTHGGVVSGDSHYYNSYFYPVWPSTQGATIATMTPSGGTTVGTWAELVITLPPIISGEITSTCSTSPRQQFAISENILGNLSCFDLFNTANSWIATQSFKPQINLVDASGTSTIGILDGNNQFSNSFGIYALGTNTITLATRGNPNLNELPRIVIGSNSNNAAITFYGSILPSNDALDIGAISAASGFNNLYISTIQGAQTGSGYVDLIIKTSDNMHGINFQSGNTILGKFDLNGNYILNYPLYFDSTSSVTNAQNEILSDGGATGNIKYNTGGGFHIFDVQGNQVLTLSSSIAEFNINVLPRTANTFTLGGTTTYWSALFVADSYSGIQRAVANSISLYSSNAAVNGFVERLRINGGANQGSSSIISYEPINSQTTYNIFHLLSDTNPTSQLGDAFLKFGAGGSNALDLSLFRQGVAYGNGFTFQPLATNYPSIVTIEPSGSNTNAILALCRLNSCGGNYEILEISSDNSCGTT